MTVREYQDTTVENDLLANIRKTAKLYGWLCYHHYDSRQSVGKGFPDLVLLREGRLLVAELKRQGRKPTTAQREWLDAFAAAGVETHVWKPSDWPKIETVLR
jgi:hypothetical protein